MIHAHFIQIYINLVNFFSMSIHLISIYNKLMQIDTQVEDSIITKLVVFGPTNIQSLKLSQIRSNKVTVGIQFQYPSIKSKIDFQMWSYPDGIKIYDSNLNIINDLEPEFTFTSFIDNLQPPDTIHSFVLTDYHLNRTYCTCLTWHEKNFIQNDEYPIQSQKTQSTIPKFKLEQLAKNPLLLDNQTAMIYVPKTIIVCSHFSCFQFQRQFLKFFYQKVIKSEPVSLKVSDMDRFQQLINKYGYPQAQNIYDERAFQLSSQKKPITFRTRFNKEPTSVPQSIPRKSLNANSIPSFYISSLFLPIFTSTPTLMVQNNQAIAYLPTTKKGTTSLPNIDILKIFQLFGIENMLLLWKCMLLQKQILVFCSCPYTILELFETLLYIIEPITWQGIYIPFLPFHLHHNVDAIGGYMIGMSHIHMDYIIQHFNLKNKCFVNIDEMIIIEEGNADNLELPKPIEKFMIDRLAQLLGKKSQNSARIFIKRSQIGSPDIKNYQNTLHSRMILEIKSVFLDGLLYLLNNYIPYVKWSEQNGVVINKQDYLANFNDNNLSEADCGVWGRFLTAMLKTMVFIRLIEYHLQTMKNLGWKQTGYKQFYVYCYNILESQLNKSDKKIWIFPEMRSHYNYTMYAINEELKKLNKAKIYKLEHYLVKYVKYLQYLTPQKIVNKRKIDNDRSWWEILTFKKEVPKVSQEDKRQRMNKNNKIQIDQVNNLENLFGWMAQVNGIFILQSKKQQLKKKHQLKKHQSDEQPENNIQSNQCKKHFVTDDQLNKYEQIVCVTQNPNGQDQPTIKYQ